VPASRQSPAVRRVVLVVLDGLRPDAVQRFSLANFARLARAGASTYEAQTVAPSVTACAMASLLSGAAPSRHGLQSDRFAVPRPRGALHPLPSELARYGLPTSVYLGRVPLLMRHVAQRLASVAGVREACFFGSGSREILAAAHQSLSLQEEGLIILHWPEADRAGHEHGWMSPSYADAARRMDESLGRLAQDVALDDSGTLLIALADHGGGGARRDHHDSEHPFDRTVPLFLAGGSVVAGDLGAGVSLLDVPATVLWSLGVPVPESYAGRPLTQAFMAEALSA